jgi:3-oxoacyl-[acyl-carrier protein] reductase
MMKDGSTGLLGGKTALVTGASRGIGAAIAKALAAQGAEVAVNYATNERRADEVVESIRTAGGRASKLRADVSRPDDIVRMAAEFGERHGRIDVLVNNAGVYVDGPIDSLTAEEFHRVFDTNALGPLLVSREMLHLFDPSGGSIVNVSALAGQFGSPAGAAYAGSKAAVDAITVSLAKELGPRGIRVNSVSPGAVETEGLADSDFMGEEMKRRVLASTPLGRLGRPDDIASAVVLLASDLAGWISGQIILTAGGLTY